MDNNTKGILILVALVFGFILSIIAMNMEHTQAMAAKGYTKVGSGPSGHWVKNSEPVE